ncbi:hypothetical protein [Antrihabitans cavernicola]|uniref:Uncharacterized protein n=1 Tax=Antrihabitans cavernicola TaxID=2495913 RepID=A0A5A7SCI1_9NOCA|nr:hypothetical protein [Spelaeibacter cavernicola]KAA0023596.1 hypothetical protein FOY51_09405 [Spelaeibacter cavernicola]
MSITALIFLGIAALAPLPLSLRRVPQWIAPIVAIIAVGVAAITAAASHKVTGFELGATAVLTIAAAAFGGIPLAPAAFRIARRQSDAGEQVAATGPLQGGRIIGILERAAVAGAIVAGWPEGMAIVLAVKGLARYPELREPHASEQFIIGTFASVLWAIAVGGIGRGLFT